MFMLIGTILYISVFFMALVYGIIKKNWIQKHLDAVEATRGIWNKGSGYNESRI